MTTQDGGFRIGGRATQVCEIMILKGGDSSDVTLSIEKDMFQGIGRDVLRAQRTLMGNPCIRPIQWVFMGYNPQESLENTTNTKYHGYTVRGTPNCPLIVTFQHTGWFMRNLIMAY